MLLFRNDCFKSNTIGSSAVFNFCLENNIKLIYSATSASLGNNGNDKNLSPYAFTKAKNLEFLENLGKWFGLKFEIVYFYNVYGPRQIKKGEIVGTLVQSGRATGPHLDIRLNWFDVKLDPLTILKN